MRAVVSHQEPLENKQSAAETTNIAYEEQKGVGLALISVHLRRKLKLDLRDSSVVSALC